MNFSSKNNILTIGSKTVEFPFNISRAEKFGEIIIVITDCNKSKTNENVWGVNEHGKKLWQIPKVEIVEYKTKVYTGITAPYSDIQKVDEQTARLYNWDGGFYDINPKTGDFTKNIIEFRKGKRPW